MQRPQCDDRREAGKLGSVFCVKRKLSFPWTPMPAARWSTSTDYKSPTYCSESRRMLSGCRDTSSHIWKKIRSRGPLLRRTSSRSLETNYKLASRCLGCMAFDSSWILVPLWARSTNKRQTLSSADMAKPIGSRSLSQHLKAIRQEINFGWGAKDLSFTFPLPAEHTHLVCLVRHWKKKLVSRLILLAEKNKEKL